MEEKETNHILSTEKLSIGYASKKSNTLIADDITLGFKESQLIGLVGINGSGKSTLLRTLAGLQAPLSGHLSLFKKPIHTIAPEQIATQLSVVLTNQPISKNLSVGELVAIGRQPYTNWIGSLSEIDKDAIIASLKHTDTFDLKDKKCYELSDGQLQRVLIARALAQDTAVILLDEPMTHLDLHHKASILKLLSKIAHTQKKTVLFSTHDIEYALKACDEMIVMQGGKALSATPQKLIETNVMSQLFPSENVGFDKESRTFFIKK